MGQWQYWWLLPAHGVEYDGFVNLLSEPGPLVHGDGPPVLAHNHQLLDYVHAALHYHEQILRRVAL